MQIHSRGTLSFFYSMRPTRNLPYETPPAWLSVDRSSAYKGDKARYNGVLQACKNYPSPSPDRL